MVPPIERRKLQEWAPTVKMTKLTLQLPVSFILMSQLNRETFIERVVCHAWNSSFQIVDKRPNVAIELLRWQQQITRWQTTRLILTQLKYLMMRQCCHQNLYTQKPARHDQNRHVMTSVNIVCRTGKTDHHAVIASKDEQEMEHLGK